jgi:acetyltransferase-like isoleucine patch superfamily enzyme
LHLGKNSTIGDYSTLIIYGDMNIGNNVMIAANSTIVDSDHIGNLKDGPLKFQGISVENILIGDDVWIGSNCSILKGSQIGDHSIIGANSLVKGKIPSSVYAFGVPAKVRKIRN